MKNVNCFLPIALAVSDVRGYCVLSNHCHWMCHTICWMVLCQAFLSLLPLPPTPSPISNLLSPSPLGRPDTQKSINIQQSFHLGHHATRYREGLKCQKKFALSCLHEGELSADTRRSFSISLNFHQIILESSPQTRFMFDIKKFNIINRCANIYSQRNTGWPQAVENCDRFARIPSNSQSRSHNWLQQSRKYRCTVGSATLPYSTTQFVIVSLCWISWRHELIYCGVLFLRRF